MKRINKTWWKGADGYYKEVSKMMFEGPMQSMDEPQERIVKLDEVVELKPVDVPLEDNEE